LPHYSDSLALAGYPWPQALGVGTGSEGGGGETKALKGVGDKIATESHPANKKKPALEEPGPDSDVIRDACNRNDRSNVSGNWVPGLSEVSLSVTIVEVVVDVVDRVFTSSTDGNMGTDETWPTSLENEQIWPFLTTIVSLGPGLRISTVRQEDVQRDDSAAQEEAANGPLRNAAATSVWFLTVGLLHQDNKRTRTTQRAVGHPRQTQKGKPLHKECIRCWEPSPSRC